MEKQFLVKIIIVFVILMIFLLLVKDYIPTVNDFLKNLPTPVV